MNPVSTIRLSDTILPWWSALDISETLESADESDVRRTVNGRVVIYGPTWSAKWRVRLSASGNATYRMPAMDGWAVGRAVIVDCLSHFTAQIGIGGAAVILSRDPVPGTVYARRVSDNVQIPVAVAGRQVTIAAQADAVAIGYRPRLSCVVTKLPNMTSKHLDASQTWDVELEEDGDL